MITWPRHPPSKWSDPTSQFHSTQLVGWLTVVLVTANIQLHRMIPVWAVCVTILRAWQGQVQLEGCILSQFWKSTNKKEIKMGVNITLSCVKTTKIFRVHTDYVRQCILEWMCANVLIGNNVPAQTNKSLSSLQGRKTVKIVKNCPNNLTSLLYLLKAVKITTERTELLVERVSTQ